MIQHLVLFKLKEEAEGRTKKENIAIAKEMASRFTTEISTCRSAHIVENMPGSPSNNEDIMLICTFDDLDGLYYYKDHPTHVAFGKFITSVREKRTSIDYEG